MLKVFLLITERLMQSILIFIFFYRVEKLSIFTVTTPLVLTLPQHYELANILEDGSSFGVRCPISHPAFSVFSKYFQRLKSAFVAV